MKVEHFDVSIPGDVYDNLEDLASLAIGEAREQSDTFVIPCNWEARLVKGEVGDFEVQFDVIRISN